MIVTTKILAAYEVICLNPKGINGEEVITVYNRRVPLDKCIQCRYFKGYNIKTFKVKCNFKEG